MELINEIFMNIFSSFTSNKIKTFRDSDPPWMIDDIKSKNCTNVTEEHQRNKENFAKLEKDLCIETDNLISKSKREYYQNINRKLNDPSTSSKTYRWIMKFCFSGKEVSAVLPLLFNLMVRLTLVFKKKQIFSISFLQSNEH